MTYKRLKANDPRINKLLRRGFVVVVDDFYNGFVTLWRA